MLPLSFLSMVCVTPVCEIIPCFSSCLFSSCHAMASHIFVYYVFAHFWISLNCTWVSFQLALMDSVTNKIVVWIAKQKSEQGQDDSLNALGTKVKNEVRVTK